MLFKNINYGNRSDVEREFGSEQSLQVTVKLDQVGNGNKNIS